MNDQSIMKDMLMTEKGACDLYMHGTIESADPQTRRAFDAALTDSLCMQGDIYQTMADQGWYPAQQADRAQVDQVRQKFQGQN